MTFNVARHFYWALLASVLFPLTGMAQDREAICDALSDDMVKHMSAPPINKDYLIYSIDAFYSVKLDACISVEAKLFGAYVAVRDLTRTVILDGVTYPILLYCDAEGVDEADIDAVRRYRGNVYHVQYKEWLTDGQGGLPRALKQPDVPLNRSACEGALKRWMAKWGP